MRTGAALAALLVIATPPLQSPAAAAGFRDQFRDDDGWFDISDWVLENATGFMPLPLAITEPAVGAGTGLAALFFHPPQGYDADEFAGGAAGQSEFVLPDITAVAAGITENDSWFLGGGHMAHWRDDRIRYEGIVGYASLNLKFYGTDADAPSSDRGERFGIKSLFVSQPFSFRVGDSDFFFGTEWEYLDLKTQFNPGTGIPEIDNITLDTRLSALRLFVTYDGLDNSFTPNTGLQAEIAMARYDEAIASDWNFDEFSAALRAYRKFGARLVTGLRVDVATVRGDVPFIAVPYIDLRGIPNLRYQGDIVAVGEVEARFALHPRISIVGFAGVGKAANSLGDLSAAASRVTHGLGLRYFLARKLGAHVGIDGARGPEDTHYYLTFGSAWD